VGGDGAALAIGGGGSVGLATYGDDQAGGRTAKGWFRGGQGDQGAEPLAGQLGDFFGEPPLAGDLTASGLPVRVPRTTMPRGTGPASPPDGADGSDGPVGGFPARSAGSGGRPAGRSQGSADGGRAMPKRSPEQARSRLSGFQRGMRRAQQQGGSGGQTPPAGEGTDR
jgi:hypothetical protein